MKILLLLSILYSMGIVGSLLFDSACQSIPVDCTPDGECSTEVECRYL